MIRRIYAERLRFARDFCRNSSSLININTVLSDSECLNKKYEFFGWVRSVRVHKTTRFIELNDGSSLSNLQVITDTSFDRSKENTITTGCSIRVSGTMSAAPRPDRPNELIAEEIEILGPASSDSFPLQKKGHSNEFLRTIMHLRSRGNTNSAVLRIRHSLSVAINRFFDENGYIQVHTPVLTSNDCEGAGELFTVSSPVKLVGSEMEGEGFSDDTMYSIFPSQVNLTVSGQLHLESYALSHQKVYTFGPTFRAENSNTPRHLCEFWMLEPELAPGTMEDAIDLAEKFVKYSIETILSRNADDLDFFNTRIEKTLLEKLNNTIEVPFVRITYDEAIAILTASGREFENPVNWDDGLALEHEKFLAEEFAFGPIVVTDYPAKVKAFYMKSGPSRTWKQRMGAGSQSSTELSLDMKGNSSIDSDDSNISLNPNGETVQAFDILFPGIGELVGGSARESDPQKLYERMKKDGLLSEKYIAQIEEFGLLDAPVAETDNQKLDWYLDLRRFGGMEHAGWGLGFERLVLYTTGVSNVRDAIPIPRVPGSCRM